jgi:predicted acylesterase/phospholipase RssA
MKPLFKWVVDRGVTFCHYLNGFGARHMCLLGAIVFSGFLVLWVPQVSYAFRKSLAIGGPTLRTTLTNLISDSMLVVLILYHGYSLLTIAPWDREDRWLFSWTVNIASVPVISPLPLYRRILRLLNRLVRSTLAWPGMLADYCWSRVWKCVVSLTLVFFGCCCLLWYGISSPSLGWYPLSDLHLINLGWMSLVLAGWLIWRWAGVQVGEWPGRVLESWERFVGWLLFTYAYGEVVWAMASADIPGLRIGYLLYTQWALLEMVFLLLILARIIDFWDIHSPSPIRLFGLATFGIFLYFAFQPVALDSDRLLANSTLPSQQEQRKEWIEYLKARLDQIPGSPVILVAVSGGGSRAAIFGSLVLEGMTRESLPNGDCPANHMLMISGVSGGSLATAWQVARYGRGSLLAASEKNAEGEMLVPYIQNTLKQSKDHLCNKLQEIRQGGTDAENRFAVALVKIRERIGDVEWAEKELQTASAAGGKTTGRQALKQSDYAWILNNQFTEDMCADFMAPLLRGLLTPMIDRGKSLERFWEEKFDWGKIHSESGLTTWREFVRQNKPLHPIVFFNASDVSSGARFIVGFPPTPQRLDFRTTAEIAQASVEATITRNPPESQTDLPRPIRLSLAQAVRLSANFPWGLPVTRIETTHLLDGGVVDNTGLDSICEVFDRLSQSDEGKLLLGRIAIRGVVVIEIDSGAKPASRPGNTPDSDGLREPLDALNNAAYTNADIAKERHRDRIQSLLISARRHWILQQRESLNSPENQRKLDKLALGLPTPLVHYPFQCERFQFATSAVQQQIFGDPSEDITPVMTAWALEPEQRGRVISHFLIELGAWKGVAGQKYREMAVILRKNADLLQSIAALNFQEELKRTVPVLESAALQSKALSRDAHKVYGAINRLNTAHQKLESRAGQSSALTRSVGKILSQEDVSQLKQLGSVADMNREVARPEEFRKDVTRLKDQLTTARKDAEDVSRKIDDAIRDAPKNKRALDKAQQAIDQKAYWTSRADEAAPRPTTP